MNIQFLKDSCLNANIKALMGTVRKCEGTDAEDGYNYLFGSSPKNNLRFDDFSKHPNIARPFGTSHSTAAGAYQVMHDTDVEFVEKSGIVDFSPENQDLRFVWLLSSRNCLQKTIDGKFEEVIGIINKTWASLPNSPYGQPTHTMEQVKGWYLGFGGELQD